MAGPWTDATVVVTGASSGIGVELARQMAPEAGTLVLVARRRQRLEALAEELRGMRAGLAVEVRPCDLGDAAAVAGLVEELLADHGQIDVLVNNAGLGDTGFFEAAEPDKLSLMIRVNVLGLTLLTRGLLPGMLAKGRGAVLNVSSGFGLVWIPLFGSYIGTKHYVTAFSEVLRVELSGTGVSVTQLCPGPVDTEFEAVAGNPTGQDVPGFIQLSPAKCAEAGLRGLRRGKAIVVPHPLIWIGVWGTTWVPRPILRFVQGFVARRMRASFPPTPPAAP